MPFIGPKPADTVLDSTLIGDGTVTTAKIADSAVTSVKVADGTIVDADVGNVAATKLTGTIADARIGASSVTQHVTGYDDSNIRADISALALREATNETSAAFNLPNSFVDTFATDVLGTKTNVGITSGYVSSITTAADANTVSIFRPNTVDHSSSTTSISSKVTGDSATLQEVNNAHSGNNLISTYQKFTNGMAISGANAGDGGWKVVPTTAYNFSTNDWTVEGWTYNNNQSTDDNHRYIMDWDGGARISIAIRTGTCWFGETADTNSFQPSGGFSVLNGFANGTWTHWAFVKDSGNLALFSDGHRQFTYSDTTSYNFESDLVGVLAFNQRHGSNTNGNFTAIHTSELRVSNNARYAASGATYTIPTAEFPTTTTTTSATGTAIQNTNTVGSAKTEVSGTIIYKDNAGTATLGTDLKIYFTCNGGTNWTEAASYNAITPVYATGIKQVRLGKTTCTSGTDVRYKAVWANQASGSKETQLHGIGINY